MTKPCYSLDDLLALMARLREPEYGCPWDLAQSYNTIVSSTLEEAYEVVDAIEQQNDTQLKEELGDLLFQIIFYSQLGKEDGKFDFHDIVSSITAKLLRRHPHVFPDGTLASRIVLGSANNNEYKASEDKKEDQVQADIKRTWDKIKGDERQQKGHFSLMDDIPVALPSTVRALKLQKRAASVKFDWPDNAGVYDKVEEEIGELQSAVAEFQELEAHNNPVPQKQAIEEEFGDIFFTLVNLARHLKVDPETALRKANHKFESRFRYIEDLAQQQSKDIAAQPTEVLEEWWQLAKKALSAS